MSDLISRQALCEYALNQKDKCVTPNDIMRLPSAQPQRKKGHWINHRKDDGHNIADCDQCGNAIQWFDGDEIPRYCCMCGADMRGEQNG